MTMEQQQKIIVAGVVMLVDYERKELVQQSQPSMGSRPKSLLQPHNHRNKPLCRPIGATDLKVSDNAHPLSSATGALSAFLAYRERVPICV